MLKERTIKYVLFAFSLILMFSMLLGLIFNGLTVAMADSSATHTNLELNIHETHTENCTHTLNGKDIEIGKVENVLKEGTAITNPEKCLICDCRIYACKVCWTKTEGADGAAATYVTNTAHATFIETKDNHNLCSNNIVNQEWYKSLSKVLDIVDSMLIPILVVIGTAGTIFVIVLGVNYSKAESADKREEAKKRMISAIIGVSIMIVLLILIKLFTANAYSIMKFVNGQ